MGWQCVCVSVCVCRCACRVEWYHTQRTKIDLCTQTLVWYCLHPGDEVRTAAHSPTALTTTWPCNRKRGTPKHESLIYNPHESLSQSGLRAYSSDSSRAVCLCTLVKRGCLGNVYSFLCVLHLAPLLSEAWQSQQFPKTKRWRFKTLRTLKAKPIFNGKINPKKWIYEREEIFKTLLPYQMKKKQKTMPFI